MNDLFAGMIGGVAHELLGEPNRRLSSKTELRYGTNGSLSIDLLKGTWFDHEAKTGGGVIGLIARETKQANGEAVDWLRERGFDVGEDREANARPKARIVATYDYVDELGDLVSQVVRFEPKTFRQRRRPTETDPPDKVKDGWVWSVKGVRQVPYRLPDLVEAIALEKTVFIAEGEKDVDALWRLGCPATTNAMGAGKWSPDLTPFFKGAEVVILPDNDPQATSKDGSLRWHEDGSPVFTGQDHGRAVAASIAPVAKGVRILELGGMVVPPNAGPNLPPKGDVSDWISAGGTVERLWALVEERATSIERSAGTTPSPKADEPRASSNDQGEPLSPLPFVDMSRWDEEAVPPRKWAVTDRIPRRQPSLLSGEGSIGKTILLLQLAVAHVLGRDWIGLLPEKGPVIYLGAEDDTDELHRRLADVTAHYQVRFSDLTAGGLHLLSFAGQDALLATADRTGVVRPTALFEKLRAAAVAIRPVHVMVDTVADAFSGSENDRGQVRQFLGLVRGLAMEADTGLTLASHPSLTGISSGTGLSGSTGWHNSVRARAYFKTAATNSNDERGKSLRELEFLKNNYGPVAERTLLRWSNGVFVPEARPSTIERAAAEGHVDDIFLQLLDAATAQGRRTSPKKSSTYAPAIFEAMTGAKGINSKAFALAQERLFAAGRIKVITEGPPSKQPV